MILEVISVGLIVSVCLALFLDEMVYSKLNKPWIDADRFIH